MWLGHQAERAALLQEQAWAHRSAKHRGTLFFELNLELGAVLRVKIHVGVLGIDLDVSEGDLAGPFSELKLGTEAREDLLGLKHLHLSHLAGVNVGHFDGNALDVLHEHRAEELRLYGTIGLATPLARSENELDEAVLPAGILLVLPRFRREAHAPKRDHATQGVKHKVTTAETDVAAGGVVVVSNAAVVSKTNVAENVAETTVAAILTGIWSLLGVARNLVALLTEGIRILASSLGGLVKGQGQSGGILVFDGGTSQVIIRLRTQWRKREDGSKRKTPVRWSENKNVEPQECI